MDTIRWTWKGINILQVLWYALSQLFTNTEIQLPTKSLGPLNSYINTDRLAAFQADNGMYWCSVPHLSGMNNIEAASPIIEEWCVFKVLSASEGKILLQDKHGMYLSRINWGGVGGIDSIMASKAKPDMFCEFEVFIDSGKIILRADNGKFLCKVVHGSNKRNIEADKTAPDEFCSFAVSSGEQKPPTKLPTKSLSPLNSYINTDRLAAFQADNGMYWCSVPHLSGMNNIEAASPIIEEWCVFKVLSASEGKILLQDKHGMYLSRINWGGVGGIDSIMASKAKPDMFCEFEVFIDSGKIILRADNGKFLCKVVHGSNKRNIEADKTAPDEFCSFAVSSGEQKPPTKLPTKSLSPLNSYINTDRLAAFQADNGMYWCSVPHLSGMNNIEAASPIIEEWCVFKVLSASEGKILLQDKQGMYLSRINWGGVGGIDSIMASKAKPDMFCEFEVFIDSGKIILRADNGKFLCKVVHGSNKRNIEADKTAPDEFCSFAVSSGEQKPPTKLPTKSLSPLNSYINTDRLAAFQADNGMYWCSVPHLSGMNNIEAASPIIEEWCVFKVLSASEGKILLQDKHGMYLSRINWGGVGGIDSIMASKAKPDMFCEFEVFIDSGKIILRADNGKFLCKVVHGSNKRNIEADKTAPDEFCSFAVSSGEQKPPTKLPTKSLSPLNSYINTDRLAAFQADNGMYWCSVPHLSGMNNIEAASPIIEEWCVFKVLSASEGKILLQDKHGMYLSRINWGGVGGIDSIMASKAKPDMFCEFEVFIDSGKIILRADNGKFLCKVVHGSNKRNIEADKTAPDEFCSFAVSSGEQKPPTKDGV
ncbi:uncharacterized protein LOC121307892 isoform X2 [Polyodon spathula]|uniref:uncharacterized protein LOC121307892 isoform X2 n=1 Tax=Polyodon spathula TaxID=7913 RepID=UPI001B7F0DC5|nr:uncharacterized protein LOC121307892 isoform X2 [Polyodon spathula]